MHAIAQIALVVHEYDEAIQFYTEKLGFVLLEDTPLSPVKRWVLLSPADNNGCKLLLARAANDEQRARVGNQTGGRVFLFLTTDNFDSDYALLKSRNVYFVREPVKESWGKVAVFEDLYGNLWDLVERQVPIT